MYIYRAYISLLNGIKLELLRYTCQTALIIYSSITFVHALNHRYLLLRQSHAQTASQPLKYPHLDDNVSRSITYIVLHD
jgi:hypothetical protein